MPTALFAFGHDTQLAMKESVPIKAGAGGRCRCGKPTRGPHQCPFQPNGGTPPLRYNSVGQVIRENEVAHHVTPVQTQTQTEVHVPGTPRRGPSLLRVQESFSNVFYPPYGDVYRSPTLSQNSEEDDDDDDDEYYDNNNTPTQPDFWDVARSVPQSTISKSSVTSSSTASASASTMSMASYQYSTPHLPSASPTLRESASASPRSAWDSQSLSFPSPSQHSSSSGSSTSRYSGSLGSSSESSYLGSPSSTISSDSWASSTYGSRASSVEPTAGPSSAPAPPPTPSAHASVTMQPMLHAAPVRAASSFREIIAHEASHRLDNARRNASRPETYIRAGPAALGLLIIWLVFYLGCESGATALETHEDTIVELTRAVVRFAGPAVRNTPMFVLAFALFVVLGMCFIADTEKEEA
ncbi:hypothetical protein EXIGLDRAFT_834062 [Exidia glandulosa HHB12029]|uniref:Uncharacterized protein n=1 Tax=Exidia glandulosa HHB12029 TaxID=1314781 RepID=A0A166AWZ7_EXIGL|nr:hypothetical protein EXIGLDRAFT_834062 [Exidia glandulosa HHB12029]